MRVNINIKTKNNNNIIFDRLGVNYAIQSLIFKMLGNLSGFYHDEGYKNNGKIFKGFVFSKILQKAKFLNDTLVFPNEISFSMAFENIDIYNQLIKNTQVFLCGQECEVDFELIKCSIKKDCSRYRIATLSPILSRAVYANKSICLDHRQFVFYRNIKKNAVNNFKAIKGYEYNGEFYLKPVNHYKIRKETVLYKNMNFKGNVGHFYINCNLEMLDLLLDCGIGEKNSQGFGMIEVINGK